MLVRDNSGKRCKWVAAGRMLWIGLEMCMCKTIYVGNYLDHSMPTSKFIFNLLRNFLFLNKTHLNDNICLGLK